MRWYMVTCTVKWDQFSSLELIKCLVRNFLNDINYDIWRLLGSTTAEIMGQ